MGSVPIKRPDLGAPIDEMPGLLPLLNRLSIARCGRHGRWPHSGSYSYGRVDRQGDRLGKFLDLVGLGEERHAIGLPLIGIEIPTLCRPR